MERLTARIVGDVQGVGYRAYARRRARALGLCGYTRNLADGAVEVVAEGPRTLLVDLLVALRRGPISAEVTETQVAWSAATGEYSAFSIRF
ncbi:MAG: acylphosphatase [Ktedonobacterales bacterium]